MTTFLLIVNRCERFDGDFDPAITVARRRLEAGKWALYANTRHMNDMKARDRVLVYLAGEMTGARHFVASAIISRINASPWACKTYKADGQDARVQPPVAVLSLKEVNWFPIPVPIVEIKSSLDFMPKTNKWGCTLQRGVKRIGETDAARILAWRSGTTKPTLGLQGIP